MYVRIFVRSFRVANRFARYCQYNWQTGCLTGTGKARISHQDETKRNSCSLNCTLTVSLPLSHACIVLASVHLIKSALSSKAHSH